MRNAAVLAGSWFVASRTYLLPRDFGGERDCGTRQSSERLWDETSTLGNGLFGRSAADRARRLHHTLASVYQAGADAGRYLRAHVWPWGRSQSPNPHALLPWGQMVLGVVVIRVLRVEEEVIVLACACMA